MSDSLELDNVSVLRAGRPVTLRETFPLKLPTGWMVTV